MMADTCFNGAASRRTRKPRTENRAHRRRHRFNGAASRRTRKPVAPFDAIQPGSTLQWSRVPKDAETHGIFARCLAQHIASMEPRPEGRGNPVEAGWDLNDLYSFNGAASRRTRKHLGSHSSGLGSAQLQWSRVPKDAETVSLFMVFFFLFCFNGAASRRTRKQQRVVDLDPVLISASMEPRPEGRGNN